MATATKRPRKRAPGARGGSSRAPTRSTAPRALRDELRGSSRAWHIIILGDNYRRGLWARRTATGPAAGALELCAGREGGEAFVALTPDEAVTPAVLERIIELLDVVRFSADPSNSPETGRRRRGNRPPPTPPADHPLAGFDAEGYCRSWPCSFDHAHRPDRYPPGPTAVTDEAYTRITEGRPLPIAPKDWIISLRNPSDKTTLMQLVFDHDEYGVDVVLVRDLRFGSEGRAVVTRVETGAKEMIEACRRPSVQAGHTPDCPGCFAPHGIGVPHKRIA